MMISPSDRETFIECPVCGKPAASRDCSYSPRGWHCFVCGSGGSLADLAEKQGLTVAKLPPLPRVAKAKAAPVWLDRSADIALAWAQHPNRVALWQAYKPVSTETIARYHLGVGCLDLYRGVGYHTSRCPHERLTYPVADLEGRVRALRGRTLADDPCTCGAGWMSVAGSEVLLWGADLPYRPGLVVVAENPVDAMLARQEGIAAVAGTGGAGTWRPEWSAYLARKAPVQVIVWYDNDLAGWPNEETYAAQTAIWQANNPRATTTPQPNGPKVAKSLAAVGIRVSHHPWARGTPVGYDLGKYISEDIGT